MFSETLNKKIYVCIGKYCRLERTGLVFSTHFHIVSPSVYEQLSFVVPFVCLYECMYQFTDGWMDASLAPERLDEFYSHSVC
jgi:hypothetical protein